MVTGTGGSSAAEGASAAAAGGDGSSDKRTVARCFWRRLRVLHLGWRVR